MPPAVVRPAGLRSVQQSQHPLTQLTQIDLRSVFPMRSVMLSSRATSRRPIAVILLVVLLAILGACTTTANPGQGGGGPVDGRIGGSEPFTWDPAAQSDAGSASVLAQVFEGLTSFDAESNVQPALAESWQADDDGQRITFQLRPGITYSDGSPISAQDVVDSWLRLIDPSSPSALASLLSDVAGAADYQAGRVGRDAVGLHADGDRVIVDLRRPATYFLAVTASPSLAVVPPSMYGAIANSPPTVVSGAYVPSVGDGVIDLVGNADYWAGVPPLDHIEIVTDYGATSPVDLFVNGQLDYTAIGGGDASWIAYDKALGPSLRQTDSFGVSYYGFNTKVAPFDDPQVRLAFAEAVDWDRIVNLSDATPATSMVPPGVPGRDEADHSPAYDPQAARTLLADAGYADGPGFPPITLATYGVGYEQTVANELAQNLGVTVNVEALDFQDYLQKVAQADEPTMWTLSWIADYPHPHDFLGLLLESGSTSNLGGWSNADYDALIGQAAATADPDQQAVFYGQAQDILVEQVPVIPVAYADSWALSAPGLEGALQSGVGLIRFAGLDWAPGSGR